MARTKRPPLQVISFVKNDNDMSVDLCSLPREERSKAMKEVEKNVIRASAAYHGYNVRFEGDTAILTARNAD